MPCHTSSTSSIVQVEGVGEGDLGQPPRHADAQRAGGDLEQREPLVGFEPVEIVGEDGGGIGARQRWQAFDHRFQRQVDFAGARPLGPHQRHRLRAIADIIAAHAVQHRIDAFLDQRADQRGLDRGQIELAGQHAQRIAAVGIGRDAQIVTDQRQLGIAPARVDQAVDQVGKSAQISPSVHFRTGTRRAVRPRRSSRRSPRKWHYPWPRRPGPWPNAAFRPAPDCRRAVP